MNPERRPRAQGLIEAGIHDRKLQETMNCGAEGRPTIESPRAAVLPESPGT
jgi:hypothetical protein